MSLDQSELALKPAQLSITTGSRSCSLSMVSYSTSKPQLLDIHSSHFKDIADPCRAITAAASSTPPAQYSGCTVISSVDFPRSTFLTPMNAVCRGGCTGDSGTCPVYDNIFSAGTTVTTCASCTASDLKERRQLLKCPTETGHPPFVHTSFHAADSCSCAT